MTRIAGSHWKLGGSYGTDSPAEAPEETKPSKTSNSDSWSQELWKKKSLVLTH